MSNAAADVLGRGDELASMEAFIGAVDTGPAVFVLRGEPGMGKTTMWRAAVDRARRRGLRLLTAAPAAAEAQLSFAALGDLFDGAVQDVLAQLPAPQREALEVALLLADGGERPPNQRAIAVASLSALRVLARSGAVLIAVDDSQWMDAPSAAVLAYAMRRLRAEPVRLLVTVRMGEGSGPLADAVERGLGDGGPQTLDLAPLDSHALHALLVRRLSLALPRPHLVRLREMCRGNPLFALEIGRALAADEVPSVGDLFPEVAASLNGLIRERVTRLEAPTQDALAAAAALARPTLQQLQEALDTPSGVRELLVPAEEADVVRIEDNAIRFTHPLLAAVSYDRVGPARRRALHARLAEVVSDTEERAAHLARAAQGPDAATARAIARAARATYARGAPGAAAELAEHARRLTPPDDRHELWSLTIDTADFSFQAGDMPATHRRLDEALQLAAPGDERAATLQRLALLATYDGSMEAARELGERALAGPTADAETLVLIHRRLSVVNLLLWDLARAERHARSAARLAEAVGRPELLARTTASLCFVRRMRGRPFSRRRFDEALRATVGAGPAAIDDDPTAIHALMLMYEGELQEARRRLCACMRGAEERGDEPHVAGLAFCLSELECRAGNFREAADLAARAVSASDETGQLVTRAPSLFATALADSYLGHADAARSAATTGLAIAERTGHRWAQAQNRWVLGSLALAAGDPAEADAQLGRVVVSLDGAGIGEPGVIPVHGDEIEALIVLGRTTEAGQMLERFRARPLAPWLRARTERQAGLLLATAGQLDPARDLLRAAVAEQARLDMRFDRARTLLVLGQVLRRARSKRESRETLQHAVAAFDELGAALWAQRARAELGRIGGRGPASHELTASERRVAERVAAGLSNKEVAAELFVAVRTVEAHLSRVYRKLGVRSRGQLAQRLAVSDNE